MLLKEQPYVVLVVLGINNADELRPWVALARGLTYSKRGARCSIATHGQYAPMLADAGVAFVDAGPCPFRARAESPEGTALDAGTQAEPPGRRRGAGRRVVRATPSLEALLGAFMGVLVRQWFEAGLAGLQRAPCDLALLCGDSSVAVYSSVCEALGVKVSPKG